MAGELIIIMAMGVTITLLGWKIHQLKKDIYTFENQLEACLDDMLSGRETALFDEQSETLWSRLYEKLRRAIHIWNKKESENAEEKRKIQALISDISHQTRTPIANIKLYQEFLHREEGLSSDGREFLKKMEGQTEKLDFLLQSMVKMSRLETGIIKVCPQKASLFETLGGAAAAAVPKAERKNIRISVNCSEDIKINHDRKWTEEAIFNVLDNAVKYTEPGGSIHIEVVVQEIYTRISIRDTGRGIALENQAEIFNRFYREPEAHKEEGIGVGLYLAREILTLQKGYIEVYSEVSKGSEFRLYLPND